MRHFPPQRIVCLTEETVETLYLMGEEQRIVGVSGYAVRPARVRKEKPRVSAFISADVPKILALTPDIVLTFSDLQADIVRDLVQAGVAVHAFNQRDIAAPGGVMKSGSAEIVPVRSGSPCREQRLDFLDVTCAGCRVQIARNAAYSEEQTQHAADAHAHTISA